MELISKLSSVAENNMLIQNVQIILSSSEADVLNWQPTWSTVTLRAKKKKARLLLHYDSKVID